MPEGSDTDATGDPTDREVACFEAGVKFGSLYHQFAGTPVGPDSADSLATAIEEAIENQPHCREVTVDVRQDELADAIAEGPAEYTELTGRFFEATVVVECRGWAVRAEMAMQDGYPLMEVVAVQSL